MFKILSIFLTLLITGTATATTIDAKKKCVDNIGVSHGGDSEGGGAVYNFTGGAIYFDNGQSTIPTECKNEVDELLDKIAKDKNDIKTVFLFAATDGVGPDKDNHELSVKRLKTVKAELDKRKIPTCNIGDDGRPTGPCANLPLGEELMYDDDGLPYPNQSLWDFRFVNMHIIYKEDMCDNHTKGTIETLIKLADKHNLTDIKTKLTEAQTTCNNQNDLLLHSQRETIMEAIQEAVEKLPAPEINSNTNVKQSACKLFGDKTTYNENTKTCTCNEANKIPDFSTLTCVDKTTTNIDGTVYNTTAELIDGFVMLRNGIIGDKTVWKNADGSFNTSRLISDSIAGVVLGTAGGLITSNVVKKNQLSNGLENIMCTIGGQPVASYGDEFRVNIQ